MIEIIFPPGCYGNYLTKCIYNYTNLRKETFTKFNFSDTGSSHDHRFNKKATEYITAKHLDTFNPTLNSTIVTVLPSYDHNLDYYNNRCYKENSQLISYIKSNYTNTDIFDKLNNSWGVNTLLDENTPLWILREWCSFWINDSWNNGYDRNKYSEISNIRIEANDIVESFDKVFLELISKLNLTLSVDLSIIQQTHFEFQQRQMFHNSQIKCIEWVNCVINNQQLALTHTTLFDEAYIQKLLRDKGYEIYCNGLNNFPKLSTEMKELIYQV